MCVHTQPHDTGLLGSYGVRCRGLFRKGECGRYVAPLGMLIPLQAESALSLVDPEAQISSAMSLLEPFDIPDANLIM
jgi:hypothetical protein